jgi:hypothetical protein
VADKEHGPFNSEREALATRAAAAIRAAFDAAPGVGASVPTALKVMTDACAECGVDLGRMDLSTLQDIAWRETFETVSLAGMIRRAFGAGQAAGPDGAEAEWGTRFLDEDGGEHMGANFGPGLQAELFARGLAAAGNLPDWRGVTVTRQVGSWTPVPGEEVPE